MRILLLFIIGLSTSLKSQNASNILSNAANSCSLTINVCENDTAEIVLSDTLTFTNMQWYFNTVSTGNKITDKNILTHVVAVEGSNLKIIAPGGKYILTTQYTNDSICVPKYDTVTVNFVSSPNLFITNPPAVCFPSSVDLTSSIITTGTNLQDSRLSYWTDINTAIPLDFPKNVTKSGKYFIKLENADGCIDVKQVSVVINPLPFLIINNPTIDSVTNSVDLMNPSVITGSNLYNGSLSFWEDEMTKIPLSISPARITKSGIYYIKATTPSGCSVTQPISISMNKF